jgi:hypothetical protein
MSKQKNSIRDKIIGTVFLTWFIASMIILVCCSEFEHGPEIMFITFGQYFLVFGILVISYNKGSRIIPFISIMAVIGLIMTSCGIYAIIGGETAIENLTKYAPLIVGLLFPYIGTMMLWSGLWERTYMRKHCTLPVDAKCIDIQSHLTETNGGGKRRRVYMPIYQIRAPRSKNNDLVEIQNNHYTNVNKFEIGNYYTIYINPENPEEFIDANNKSTNGAMIFLGIVFILVSVPIMYLIVDNLGIISDIKTLVSNLFA